MIYSKVLISIYVHVLYISLYGTDSIDLTFSLSEDALKHAMSS